LRSFGLRTCEKLTFSATFGIARPSTQLRVFGHRALASRPTPARDPPASRAGFDTCLPDASNFAMAFPTAKELTDYLHAHIPLSAAMKAEVLSCNADSAELRAPLAPNINHRNTVFGGSASALALLAGWTLLHARLVAEGRHARLVIQEHSMHFRRPLESAFTAHCAMPAGGAWERFIAGLDRKGSGRITLKAVLRSGDTDAAFFEGEYVALDTR
jgi:thioesterase domain-containing protein